MFLFKNFTSRQSIFLFIFISSLSAVYGVSKLFPSKQMQQETQWLIQALEKAHYKKVSINELNASSFLVSYLKKLDRQRLYFTREEAENFINQYSTTIITFLKQGNLHPGFEIYNAYKLKANNRLKFAISMIDNGLSIDNNSSYDFKRDENNWETGNLDNVWQKLIIHDVLTEVISDFDLNNTINSLSTEELNKLISESKESVKNRYERWLKNINEFEPTDIQELYLTSLTQMFDPHTTFLNIKEKEKFDQTMNNELVGIGAVLSDVDGFCTIKELLPGGPAEASQELQPEDVILKVGQAEGNFTDVVDMKLSNVVELIKGPKDTLVRLEVKPINDPSKTKVVRIIRDKIKLTSNLAKASIHKVIQNESALMLA